MRARLNLAKDEAHASRHATSREGIEKLALIRVIRVHPSNYIASRRIGNPVPLASLINLLINTSDLSPPSFSLPTRGQYRYPADNAE